MRTVYVIGIGAGSPKHVTVEAIEALQAVDAVVALDKGDSKDDLLGVRRQILAEHAPKVRLVSVVDPPRDRQPGDAAAYRAEVRRWHSARAQLLTDALVGAVDEGGSAAFLVWGDPSLYDSTLRIIDRMRGECGLECEVRVIPGITSVQALTAAHGILINRIGEAIHVTTARNLPATSAADRRNCVVMLDGGAGWREVSGPNTYMWWGAYVGTDMQVLRSGWVSDIGDDVAELKASLREQHGWIMDVYLLRELDGHEEPSRL